MNMKIQNVNSNFNLGLLTNYYQWKEECEKALSVHLKLLCADNNCISL